MSKETLKREIIDSKGNHCVLSNQELPDSYGLFDTHRDIPKAEGGVYALKNTGVVIPIEHMKHHATHRVRKQLIEKLKAMIDDRNQTMKLKNKINNQILAYKRQTDHLEQSTLDFLNTTLDSVNKELGKHDRRVEKHLKTIDHPLVNSALSVYGIGPVTVAYCLAYIDLEKARHASSLWAYTGLDKPSHSRYEKGVAGGGNKTLRTVLYTMADSQMRSHGPYRKVYDNVKYRLSMSDKLVKSRNTQGQLVEIAWKDTKPCHRHGAALRAIMKHFLADYWWVGRTLAGLETSPIYAEAQLGMSHKTIMPYERGWKY